MAKKPKIAIFTTIQGHESIAESVQQILDPQYEVVVFHDTASWMKYYQSIYVLFPGFFQVPYRIAKNQKIVRSLNEMLRKKYKKRFADFLEKNQPDLLINTYFAYLPALEHISSTEDLPLLNVITDPRSIHPILISSVAQSNLVFDQNARALTQKIYPDAKYDEVGWFVRKQFTPVSSSAKKQLKQKLKLHPEYLTFFIATGSEGTTAVLKILPLLFKTSQPVQVIVACGKNRRLYQAAAGVKNLLKKMKSKNLLVPIKFTKEIHQYMQASDLIIGKAGPNMLFEAIATHTPFFAITHIAGQEDGNLEIIKDYNLGYVEENPFKASTLLQKIIKHPELLEKVSSSIQRAAEENSKAANNLQKLVALSINSKKLSTLYI